MIIKITSILYKKNLLDLLNTEKLDNIRNIIKIHNIKIPGKILQVSFNKQTTKFEMTDFIKVSKKHRSNVIDVFDKDIFQYNFTGICIKHKKDYFDINTSFLLRNVFDSFPYELNVPLNSPMIDHINILSFRAKLINKRHNKFYFLRDKPIPLSKIPFDYVIGMFAEESILIFDKDQEIKQNMDIYNELDHAYISI